jgi:hypothetical protein
VISAFRTFETGQFFSAAVAISLNWASLILGILAVNSKSTLVIVEAGFLIWPHGFES